MDDRERAAALADQLYAALAGPGGLNCCGSCAVDGPCLCRPVFEAISLLRLLAEQAAPHAPADLREAREPTPEVVEAAIKAARQHIYIGDDADGDPCIVGFELGIRAALAAKEGEP